MLKKSLVALSLFAIAIAAIPLMRGAAQTPAPVSPLLARYDNSKIKLLIVPGHDNDPSLGGTQFGNLIEADLNVELAKAMIKIFSADSHFEVITTRDETGYKEPFATYFTDQRQEIISFRNNAKSAMRESILKGITDGIISPARDATDGASVKLYGINKWINENSVDIALHLHFNDYAGRRSGQRGRYSGFVMFIPERQLQNHNATIGIGQSIFERLKKYFPVSNNPGERKGLLEDQELIALGGSQTLKADTVSLFIEYGYIYENQWLNPGTREMILKELSYQTYMGVKKYFEPGFVEHLSPYPYVWKNQIKISPIGKTEVLALQIALTKDGLYPPSEFYPNQCPISGIFGMCTRKAILKFQARHKLAASGFVDGVTLRKVNDVYQHSLPELMVP